MFKWSTVKRSLDELELFNVAELRSPEKPSSTLYVIDESDKKRIVAPRRVPTEVKAAAHGNGLFATIDLPAGVILDRYVGELVPGRRDGIYSVQAFGLPQKTLVGSDKILTNGRNAHLTNDGLDLAASVRASYASRTLKYVRPLVNCELVSFVTRSEYAKYERKEPSFEGQVAIAVVTTQLVTAGDELLTRYGNGYWSHELRAALLGEAHRRAQLFSTVPPAPDAALQHALATRAGQQTVQKDAGWPPVHLIHDPQRGIGVIAAVDLPPMIELGTYDGPRVAQVDAGNVYVIKAPSGGYIDASDPNQSSWPRFINSKWRETTDVVVNVRLVPEDDAVVVRTIGPIKAGSQLFLYYGKKHFIDPENEPREVRGSSVQQVIERVKHDLLKFEWSERILFVVYLEQEQNGESFTVCATFITPTGLQRRAALQGVPRAWELRVFYSALFVAKDLGFERMQTLEFLPPVVTEATLPPLPRTRGEQPELSALERELAAQKRGKPFVAQLRQALIAGQLLLVKELEGKLTGAFVVQGPVLVLALIPSELNPIDPETRVARVMDALPPLTSFVKSSIDDDLIRAECRKRGWKSIS